MPAFDRWYDLINTTFSQCGEKNTQHRRQQNSAVVTVKLLWRHWLGEALKGPGAHGAFGLGKTVVHETGLQVA